MSAMSQRLHPSPAAAHAGHAPSRRDGDRAKRVVVLSSSLLVDRMLVHTGFMGALSSGARVDVWATSADNASFRPLWAAQPATVRALPEVRPFRESLHNYPRRLNEAVWDLRHRDPSRLSIRRHQRAAAPPPPMERAIDAAARILSLVPGLEGPLECALDRWLRAYERSPEATRLLRGDRPDAVVTTGPFQFEQPAIVASAQRLGVPTLALVPSWDNLSTKKRMPFRYDGYIVWSEQMRSELHEYYSHTRDVPVYVVGAPQFDVFRQPRLHRSREAYCASQGLRAELPIVVYAVGSPNFLKGEPDGALQMAHAVARGELGEAQLLVRPHPIHDNAEMERMFGDFGPRVRLQRTASPGTPLTARSQDEGAIVEWVNTFRHANVVVNLSSTVTVDAALFDCPVVNLDYDPGAGGADDALISDINHLWTHFKPVAESGGVWLARNFTETVAAVRTYLAHPELHRDGRRWIATYVCGHTDGWCGERLAEAILAFAHGRAPQAVR